jgi:hypothetical protein
MASTADTSGASSAAATPTPPPSRSAAAQEELIAVLRANLAESMKLNEEFEDDLRVAVQCMADCEAQREADVAALEAKIGAMQEEQLHGRHHAAAVTTPTQRGTPPPPPEPPAHAMSSTARALESRATELFNRAGETKFRHLDSLTNNDGADGGTDEGESSEVTLRLRVPVRVPPTSARPASSNATLNSRQQLSLAPSRVPATRSKSPRPRSTSEDPSPSEYEARQPAAGLVTADTERTIRQLQLEVVHLRQRLAMATAAGRRAGSPTSAYSDANAPLPQSAYQQAESRLRARLATAVQDTLLKGLAKATVNANVLCAHPPQSSRLPRPQPRQTGSAKFVASSPATTCSSPSPRRIAAAVARPPRNFAATLSNSERAAAVGSVASCTLSGRLFVNRRRQRHGPTPRPFGAVPQRRSPAIAPIIVLPAPKRVATSSARHEGGAMLPTTQARYLVLTDLNLARAFSCASYPSLQAA